MYALASPLAPISSVAKIPLITAIRDQSFLAVAAGRSAKAARVTVSTSPKICQSSLASAAARPSSLANVTMPSPFCSPRSSLYSLTRRTAPTLANRFCTAVKPTSFGMPVTYAVHWPAFAASAARFSRCFSDFFCAFRRRASSAPSAAACWFCWNTPSHAASSASPSSSSPSLLFSASSALRLRAFSRRSCSFCMARAYSDMVR